MDIIPGKAQKVKEKYGLDCDVYLDHHDVLARCGMRRSILCGGGGTVIYEKTRSEMELGGGEITVGSDYGEKKK